MEYVTAVIPAHYGELARLAWNRDSSRPITGEEALALYEANWRHVDIASLSESEKQLIGELTKRFGAGHLLATK
jgi:hypothetical protein